VERDLGAETLLHTARMALTDVTAPADQRMLDEETSRPRTVSPRRGPTSSSSAHLGEHASRPSLRRRGARAAIAAALEEGGPAVAAR
jgi:hypothetical protein